MSIHRDCRKGPYYADIGLGDVNMCVMNYISLP